MSCRAQAYVSSVLFYSVCCGEWEEATQTPDLPFPSGSPHSPGRCGTRRLCRTQAWNWSFLGGQATSVGPNGCNLCQCGGLCPGVWRTGLGRLHHSSCFRSTSTLLFMSFSCLGHQGAHPGPPTAPAGGISTQALPVQVSLH